MAQDLNIYGDQFKPTAGGHGVDISSQRMDALDMQSLALIDARRSQGKMVAAIDLGGGFGAHSIRMARAGAGVTMVDVTETARPHFAEALRNGLPPGRLRFIHKDFSQLTEGDFPEAASLLYSQRAIHYLPYNAALATLTVMFNVMTKGGRAFVSAAGYDTEYGQTYPGRDRPVQHRYEFVMPDMQRKHAIHNRIVIYREAEFANLLREAGFTDIEATRSAFGNIKATACRP